MLRPGGPLFLGSVELLPEAKHCRGRRPLGGEPAGVGDDRKHVGDIVPVRGVEVFREPFRWQMVGREAGLPAPVDLSFDADNEVRQRG